jgi:M penetrans paralogue family 26
MENETLDNKFNVPNNGGGYVLPNSTAVLVLGILSILGCFCYGIIGLILGIIALVLAQKDLRLVAASPGQFNTSSLNNLKAGRVCAIIGVSLSAIYVLIVIAYIIFFGTLITSGAFNEFIK